ncbi:MAG: cation transporter [Actinomycetota bacterium]|nr:cation transporter [Actinomycetota bacterium]
MASSPSRAGLTQDRRSALVRRIRFLVIFTISYNVIEAVVALFAGSVANSSALIGFGLDSVIEVSSALAVAWQFSGGDHEAREKTALRVIALSFFGLAAFVGFDAVTSLLSGQEPEHSTVGIVIAALSLLVMPTVSFIQRRAGLELGSQSAVADSKQTLLCTYMSGALLVGLLANSLLGWWWADPIAALLIAALAIREGLEAWRGEVCSPAELLFEHDHDHDHDDDHGNDDVDREEARHRVWHEPKES